MTWSLGTVPGGRIGNDVALATVAGYTFAWAGERPQSAGGSTGGLLSLRLALRGASLGDVARALGRLDGVRVVSGPVMSGGGECYVVHCPGFKMVLSSPEPGSDTASGLVSRTAPPPPAFTSPLAAALDGLMRASAVSPPAAGSGSARR